VLEKGVQSSWVREKLPDDRRFKKYNTNIIIEDKAMIRYCLKYFRFSLYAKKQNENITGTNITFVPM
jgi:hypothetical protein